MTTLSPSSSSPVPRQLRLLIVDDRPDVLQDLKLLLELSGGMKINGEARNGFEAVHLAKDLLPDVVLMASFTEQLCALCIRATKPD